MQPAVKQPENQANKTSATKSTFFGGSGAVPFFQAKLTSNHLGDKSEQEAAAVTDRAVSPPSAFLSQTGNNAVRTASGIGHSGSAVQRVEIAPAPAEDEELQRKCADCEQEEQVQRMESPEETSETVQRAEAAMPTPAPGEKEEELQRKCADCEQEEQVQRTEAPKEMPDTLQRAEATMPTAASGEKEEEIQRQCADCEQEEQVQRTEAPEEIPEAVQRTEIPVPAAAPAEKEEEIQRKCADCEQEEEQVQRMEASEEMPETVQRVEATPAAIPSPSATTDSIASSSASETTAHNESHTTTSAVPTAVNSPTGVQASLKVGAPDDRFEREADEMAEKVQRMPQKQWALPNNLGVGNADTVQRQEEDEPDIQGKIVQRAPALQRAENGSLTASSQFSSRLQTASGGSPLPDATRQHMEGAFNADFSNVRIHTNTEASQLSSDIGARAFTHKNDIYFNNGEYNPGSSEGQFLLAHELTHTVQQGAAMQRAAIPTQIDPAMEEGIQTSPIPDIQASMVEDALAALGNIADRIPGYRLFTVLIQRDLIRGTHVEFNAENLVDGVMSLIPFGHDIFLELQRRGIIAQAFAWVREQMQARDLTASRLQRIWENILEIPWSEAFSPIEFANAQLRPLLNDAIAFARAAIDELMRLVKEALTGALRELVAENRGYALLTKILHHDPITDQHVDASTVEIVEDFLRLIGRETELEQMRIRGTLQRTADWIDTQVGTFMSLLGELRGIFTAAWDAIQPQNLPNIVENLSSLATRFGTFLTGVWDFALTVAAQVLQIIKDSLLAWLRTHANGIRGYRLLTVLIGKDPVTDEVVERSALNILSGFVELVAGPEKFEQIQQSGAIERMVTWLNGVTERLGINFQMIRDLFVGIWEMLSINDLIDPVSAFRRVVDRFGEKIAIVLEFVVEVIKKIIEVVLDIMQVPIEVGRQIVERVMAAYEIIKRDPIAFFLNLLRAVKQGFEQFFGKIGEYLLQGLTGWLFSELEAAGIRPPQDFSLRSIIGFVFEVLGINMERIWQKLGEHRDIGPERVARIRGMIGQLTGIWTIVQEVITEGPGALWRHLKEQLSNLWDMVLEQVKSWVMERIINQMVTRLLSMLDPSGIMAVVRSVQAMYNAVQSFIQRIAEIMRIINSFVGGILEVAQGNVAPAANYLERTMANAMPTIIGFLANQVGLSGLGQRIGEMIERVRELVDQGLTWLVDRMVRLGRSLLGMGGGNTLESVKQDVHREESQYLTNNSITREEAGNVATTVANRNNSVVSAIHVIDGGATWNYNLVQRTEEEIGPRKEGGNGDDRVQKLDNGSLSVEERESLIRNVEGIVNNPTVIDNIFNSSMQAQPLVTLFNKIIRENLTNGYRLTANQQTKTKINIKYFGLRLNSAGIVVAEEVRGITNKAFGYAEIKANNNLALHFLAHPDVRSLGIDGAGPAMFRIAFDYFNSRVNIEGINGWWLEMPMYEQYGGRSINLRQFLEAKNAGASDIEAVKRTWTYSQAREEGYTEIKPNSLYVGPPNPETGIIDEVSVTFIKPTITVSSE